MTTLYIADISGLDIEKALACVSEYRRQKALKCKMPEDMRRCLGVELLLCKALGLEKPEYCISPNGKPYFENSETYFSFSHSGSHAVCAVSDSPIGVDIESPRCGSAKIAERFFSEEEYKAVISAPNPDDELCRIWTRKESFIKATGKGLKDIKGIDTFAAEGFEFKTFTYEFGYISLCKQGAFDETEIKTEVI